MENRIRKMEIDNLLSRLRNNLQENTDIEGEPDSEILESYLQKKRILIDELTKFNQEES